jgi:hypothetical protein
MASQGSAVPIRNAKNEPISWPNTDKVTPLMLPVESTESANEIYRDTLASAERVLGKAKDEVSQAAASAARSVRRFANERPLHFVGIIAGISLLAGVALRIWRSKRYA